MRYAICALLHRGFMYFRSLDKKAVVACYTCCRVFNADGKVIG